MLSKEVHEKLMGEIGRNDKFIELMGMENLALLTQLGVSIAVPPILCLLAANWLRGKWGLGLWIMIVALVLGLGGSASNVWKFWKQLKKREERDENK